MIEPGDYIANAVSWGIGESGQKKTPFLQVKFALKGMNKSLYWQQWLTPNTADRAMETLINSRLLATKSFADVANGEGLRKDVEVSVSVIHEEYEKDGETKTAVKIAWVNPTGERASNLMDNQEAVTKLAGLNLDAIILAKGFSGQENAADDIPF